MKTFFKYTSFLALVAAALHTIPSKTADLFAFDQFGHLMLETGGATIFFSRDFDSVHFKNISDIPVYIQAALAQDADKFDAEPVGALTLQPGEEITQRYGNAGKGTHWSVRFFNADTQDKFTTKTEVTEHLVVEETKEKEGVEFEPLNMRK